MKRSFLTFVVLVALLSLSSVALAQDAVPVGPITQAILDRGSLICGVNANVPGFGVVNEAGEYAGFDIDFCHAIAAAILGDANAVTFRPLNGSERQAAIQGGEVDMISRNTTWTLSRDTTWGATFGPTTFYDGQGIGTTVASGIQTMEDLDGGSICVQSGTTTELNLTDAITKRGLTIEVQTYPDAPSTWEAFVAGRCDAWTTDKSGIVSLHATAEDPSAYTILDVTLSKEPLGPLSPQSDPQFADIVAWTVYGMITAEEYGITSQNIDEFLTSTDPGINRLLGQNGEQSGSYLGIANDFMVTVVRQVGNYAEVYDRNLGVAPFNLSRSQNALWSDGGLLYAPPFR